MRNNGVLMSNVQAIEGFLEFKDSEADDPRNNDIDKLWKWLGDNEFRLRKLKLVSKQNIINFSNSITQSTRSRPNPLIEAINIDTRRLHKGRPNPNNFPSLQSTAKNHNLSACESI